MKRLTLIFFMLLGNAGQILAENSDAEYSGTRDITEERALLERQNIGAPFVIMPHRANYVIPGYYNSRQIKLEDDSRTHKPRQLELKFQVSFKLPLFKLAQGQVYAAYTQQSYWQAYTDSPFFRESNYEPELFWQIPATQNLVWDWQLKFIDLGVNHESNGRGGAQERSWNRVYVTATMAKENWQLKVQPWLIIKDRAARVYNPDIKRFKGYGSVEIAYKTDAIIFAVKAQNLLESQFRRGSVQLAMAVPLNDVLSVYTQIFSGYGQNLIQYNQYTNAIGIGFSLNHII